MKLTVEINCDDCEVTDVLRELTDRIDFQNAKFVHGTPLLLRDADGEYVGEARITHGDRAFEDLNRDHL